MNVNIYDKALFTTKQYVYRHVKMDRNNLLISNAVHFYILIYFILMYNLTTVDVILNDKLLAKASNNI